MKYNRIVILTAAVATLPLCGCQRDSLIPAGSAIRYEVGVADIATKGELVNNNVNNNYSDIALADALSLFKVAAYNGASPVFTTSSLNPANVETASYASSSWTMPNTYYWPQNTVLTFFAYANLPAEGSSVAITSEGQTLTHEMLSDVADQTDILLGYYQGRGVNGNTAKIRFQHPLTSVFFKAGEMGNETITSISLSGLAASGSVAMDADGVIGAWDVDDYTATSSQSDSEGLAVNTTTKIIGEPFILIPQNLATNGVKLTVKCKSGLTLETTIGSGEWKAQKTNYYTIGCEPPTYNYTFTLEGGETSGSQDFRNTTYTGMDTITIVSEKENGTGTVSPAPWLIKSVQVGSEAAQTINASSFSGIGDLSAETTADGNLKLTASERINSKVGGHEYWTGSHGLWSPEDWTSTTANSPIDLSKFDFKTEANDIPMTTANCYIIRHAGTYKIPLVYGNGVVDGNENTQSYFPDETGGTNRLERFLNHKGSGIQSAFIENNDGCKAAGSSIVWQDEAFVIKNLEIVGSEAGTYTKDNVRYLQFTVDPSTICQNNAVIAVKDEAGKIMWSWLIWTTNDPGLLGNPYKVSNTYGEYSFFQMNSIGWMDATEYPARDNVVITIEQPESGKTIEITVEQPIVSEPAHGNYYQFGRKDPMCRKDSPVSDGFFMDGVGKVDLQTAIMNPGTFISDAANPGDWCSSTYDNLWTGKVSVRYEGSDPPYASLPAHTKTVYDPSPAGFKMPTKLALKVDGSTLLFPAQGYRHHKNVTIYYPDHSYYWSATPYDGGMYGNGTSVDVSPRSQGFSVRPVQE